MKNPNFYAYRSTAVDYDDDEDNDFDDNEDSPDKAFAQNGNFYNFDNSKRHPKKRKLESFVSNYEFAPHSESWSEDEIFGLLEVWGERYIELGRRSLRAEDWVDVMEKVTEMSGRERTEGECRSQLDMLKNKYKKEMVKVESGGLSKWVFFKKMDALLNLRNRGYGGLGCGLDSGEYVFMNPRVYLDMSNVLDEMRDSPGQSDEDADEDGGEDGEEDLSGDDMVDGESARMLANSIQKFGEVYEKIEESKRMQMVELETMKQDFQRDLELQKKQIVERAQTEIAKIREMDDDEDENTDTSAENFGD
ncbi:trihelix transcription factor ASIL2-like [Salvia divinorum]|uniref:Trihelix transcription factor ASIL2-like n=1 Tax=Salvia divinorum TaxID=28513 RepID=A0ABD1I3U3_SALDI